MTNSERLLVTTERITKEELDRLLCIEITMQQLFAEKKKIDDAQYAIGNLWDRYEKLLQK